MLRNITINIPFIYETNIQKLIKLGLYSSRSQLVREALYFFLKKENVVIRLLNLKEEQKAV